MARRIRNLTIAVALFGIGFLTARPTVTIEGQVTDPSGAAVAAAYVQVVEPDGTIRNSRTDSQGRYHLAGLFDGDYTVIVSSPGFTRYESERLHITSARARTLDVRLEIQQQS